MKIVFINSHLGGGGAERVITLMANYWAEAGHEVYLMTLAKRSTPCAYPLHEKVNRVSAQDNAKGRWALLKLFDFRRNLAQLSPDVVISFQDETNILTRIVTIKLNCPLIIAERNHPEYLPLSWYYKIARRILYPLCDCLVVQTRSIHDWFSARGYSLPMKIIPNPILDVDDRVSLANEIQIGNNAIVTVGRLTKAKGHDRLIDIFKKVVQKRPEWKLYIAGEGPCRFKLEQRIAEYGIKGNLVLLGQVENPIAILKQAKIFVFTSYWEGFPNALCEAMAAGLAVVSFDCPSGPADIIEHEKNGMLIPKDDEDRFETALIALIEDCDMREGLGREAIKIKEKLSIGRIMEMWERVIIESVSRQVEFK